MRRVVIVGPSGVGKSTLAQALAHRLRVPHVELDALHWGSNWTSTPTDILRPRVAAALSSDGWTVSGNYLKLRDIVWSRADTIIWLDYPMTLVMLWVLRRTLHRCITGEPMWDSNNVETWRMSFFSTDSILVWAVTTWRKNRWVFPRMFRSPECQHLRAYRFTSPKQTQRWLDRLPGSGN